MKKSLPLLIVLSCFALRTAFGDQPRGSFLELHSCELYAGGCVVSSEATLDGRYMLRAWNFTGGNFGGADLAGLQVAVLETSAENLAAADGTAEQGIIYLPQSASTAQRKALVNWLGASQPGLKVAKLRTRVVPLRFETTEKGYAFSAGKGISVKSVSLDSCDTGACGEALWYSPRATTSIFTVARDQSSRIAEPLLKLTWTDGGKRSVFLGKFGETARSQGVYVTASDLCGPADKLF